MALIYKSASLFHTLAIALLTIFGFILIFFLSAPKLWSGSGFSINTAHAETGGGDGGGCSCCESCGCSGCQCGGAGAGGGTQ